MEGTVVSVNNLLAKSVPSIEWLPWFPLVAIIVTTMVEPTSTKNLED